MKENTTRGGPYWTILILSMTVSAGLAIALGQDGGFDLLNYHYYSGFALLHKPFGYDFAPAQIQSFYNPLMHVFSYLTLAHLSAKSAAALLGAVQGINFYLVFRISQILFAGWGKRYRYILGLVCAGAGFYGIASKTEMGATYGDNVISIPVLAGLLLVLALLRMGEISGKKATAILASAGFLVGAAFGLKFTCAIYLLGLVLAYPLTIVRSRGWGQAATVLACGATIGFLATYGLWGTKLYSSFQNPVFPHMNEAFQSPYYESTNFFDDRFLPRNWQQTIFYPFFFMRNTRLVSEVNFRDVRLALCYVAIATLAATLLLNFRSRRETAAGDNATDSCLIFLALFFAVSYAGWLRLSSIYRYLAVLELLAPAFLALTINRFLKKESAVLITTGALTVFMVAYASPISFGRMEFTNELLKVQVPQIGELDHSVVLLSGYEPIAFIVPSFPHHTRFVRVSSTFSTPGKNRFLDTEIQRILSGYDLRHRFAYVPNVQEIGQMRLDASAYGTKIDANSCYEIRSQDRGQNRGYLCGVAGEPMLTGEKPAPEIRYVPKFVQVEGVELSGSAESNFLNGRVQGIRTGVVDILYELDGELMPVIRRWALEDTRLIHLGPLSRDGNYRVIGIRDSNAPDPDTWIPVNIDFRIIRS